MIVTLRRLIALLLFTITTIVLERATRPDVGAIETLSSSAATVEEAFVVPLSTGNSTVNFFDTITIASPVVDSSTLRKDTSTINKTATETTKNEETDNGRNDRGSSKSNFTVQPFDLSEVPSMKLPTPVIVLSLPKSGTTSVYHFFHRNGIPTSHYCCRPGAIDHPPCSPPELRDKRTDKARKKKRLHLCGNCIERNLENHVAPLQDCGDDYFQVYAQMDVEKDNSIVLPQIIGLEQIHEHYPNATFILGTRDPQRWVRSVRNWFSLTWRFRNLDLPDYPAGTLKLTKFYQNHTKRVRDFVQKHPSHRLIEINIEDDSSGSILGDAFGLNSTAWGRSNARLDL